MNMKTIQISLRIIRDFILKRSTCLCDKLTEQNDWNFQKDESSLHNKMPMVKSRVQKNRTVNIKVRNLSWKLIQ